MICSVCETINEEDANYCIRCNNRLMVVCPRCNRRVVSHAQFCDRCGLALESPKPAPMDEQKLHSDSFVKSAERFPVNPQSPQELQFQSSSSEIEEGEDKIPQPAREISPLEKYYPKELMKKLETARTSGDMAGERRVVTMMFCDVKGSTSAAEQLDPEEWSEIINGVFEHMIKPVYKYEGTVARLMGDGILAFFGAPLAHEDDPQRAVLAGLDIVSSIFPYKEMVLREWGIEFDVRIGINTGLVVVGAVGSDLRMEYTAMGDAINLAARMEQTA